ncbi:MAG: DUF1343 domain-containing protein [Deltaproteobacteria bacterium]|nr:DUF1343 domain-containing protein [Deltaproteobacteria bacterium]
MVGLRCGSGRASWLVAGVAASLVVGLASSARAEWPRCRTRALPEARLAEAGFVPELSVELSLLLEDAVQKGLAKAAALIVVRNGKVVYRGTAGAARRDSIFDLASLTKVLVTAPAVLRLVEQGRLGLDDPIGRHVPWLRGTSKQQLTLRQLALHVAGLPSVVWKGPLTDGRDAIFQRIAKAKLRGAAGAAFKYSDLGYILLGEAVAARSGKSLDRAVADALFAPLGLCDTGFAPPREVLGRVVTPWPEGGKEGEVYDPLAWRMGKVAGHAGLYSTLDDLALFGQMLLEGGTLRGRRVLSARSVAELSGPHSVPGVGQRGFGFRLDRGRQGQAGALSPSAYGHTGYTGTSLWIDPERRLVVALLTNRTYLEPPPSVGALRARVHDVVKGSLVASPARVVTTGLDRLHEQGYAPLRGRRVGLITNQTAIDRQGRWIVDLLEEAPGVKLVSLFVPEHGLKAQVDRRIHDSTLTRGGQRVPVYSLFGSRRRPTDATLAGLDTLVFDVAAVGVRYYTYLATMGWAMEEAARRKLRFVVLDRPNPLGGEGAEGPVSSATRRTSTNYHPVPLRYGMTVGELARLYNAERRIGADLVVVPARGWRRAQLFPEQGLPWRDPSPNIRSWRQALLYAGIGFLESTNVAVGRGTDAPFQWFGAPWLDGPGFAQALAARKVPGFYVVPRVLTPKSGPYRGERCSGVQVILTDGRRARPVRLGLEVALLLRERHRQEWETKHLYRLINDPPTTEALLAGQPAERILRRFEPALARFLKARRRYLLYPD